MNLKYELQNIISGVGQNSKRNLIEAAAYQLGQGKETDGDTQAVELTKDQEAARLVGWINHLDLPILSFSLGKRINNRKDAEGSKKYVS